MSLVKPNILAEALGITTDALRKRRYRVTKSSNLNTDAFDYTVTGSGRVMYQLDSLPQSVRATVSHEAPPELMVWGVQEKTNLIREIS